MTTANHIFLPWVQPAMVANAPRSVHRALAPTTSRLRSRCASTSRSTPARSSKSVRAARSGRRHRHRSATGRPARAETRHRRLRDQLLPVRRVRSPRLPLAVQPGEGRRPAVPAPVARARGRAPSAGRGAAARRRHVAARARHQDAGPAPPTSCPTSPSRTSGPTPRRPASGRADLGAEIAADSVRTVSRLMCARRLDPATELPRVRGAGLRGRTGRRPRRADGRCRRCCRRGPSASAPPSVELPVYLSWEFRTSDGGEFEELVRRLQPRELPADAGKRPMDISHPGFILDPQPEHGAAGTILGIEGALRPVDSRARRVARRDPPAVPVGAGGDRQHAVATGDGGAGWRPDRRPADLRRLARRRARSDPGRRRQRRGAVAQPAQSRSATSRRPRRWGPRSSRRNRKR